MLDYIDEKYKLRQKILIFPFWLKPNLISTFGLFAAVISGFLFYFNYFLAAGVLVGLNGYFDILDGYMAKKQKKTKLGDFIDHTFDRISDVVILLGISLSSAVNAVVGLITIIVVLLVSYLGTQSQAITADRLYSGIFCRADRILLIMVAGFLMPFFESALYYCVLIILFLSIITFVQRFILIYKKIRD